MQWRREMKILAHMTVEMLNMTGVDLGILRTGAPPFSRCLVSQVDEWRTIESIFRSIAGCPGSHCRADMLISSSSHALQRLTLRQSTEQRHHCCQPSLHCTDARDIGPPTCYSATRCRRNEDYIISTFTVSGHPLHRLLQHHCHDANIHMHPRS